MVFQIKADNRALIWINDTFVDSVDGEAIPDVPDALVGQALHTGLNEIRISLVDWGSIVGINYRIDVTMTSAEDISNAVLTPENAAALNHAPVADAGADQSLETPFASYDVTLDASASSDEDGNLLSFTWQENGSEIATGENPTVSLAEGIHNITLIAYDGELNDSDEVVITVTRLAPAAATDPIPSNGAIDVTVDQPLSWAAVDGATGYRINLGTDNPPTSIENATDLGDVLNYASITLDYSTTYYWSVTPYNGSGDASGVEVWSFTTMDENTVVQGETCEDPFIYGAVNGAAMMGDLASGGHDWYSFTTDGTNAEISISLCNSNGLGDSQIAVFADCGDVVDLPPYGDTPTGSIAHNDDACGLLSAVTLTGLGPGTYYIAVYGYNEFEAGAYELVVSGANDPCAGLVDNYEPNDDMASATLAGDGATFNAALCPTADSDWYAVPGLAMGTLSVETLPLNSDNLTTDTYMNLYDADGNLLVSDDDGGSGYTSLISFVLPSDGIYFVEVNVSSWAAGSVFDYTLHVTVGAPATPGPQNLVATGGDDLVDLTWDPAPVVPEVLRSTDSVSPLKTSNPKHHLDPAKAQLAAIYSQKQMRRQAMSMNNGSRELGDTCGEAIAYGPVNAPALPGDLPAAGQDWYSFSSDGSLSAITISLCNSNGIEDPQLAVFANCDDVVNLPYYAEPPAGAIAFNDDACGLMAEITMADLAPGTYYVAVYGYTESDFGAYELAITAVTDSCTGLVDTYEPNDVPADATPVADGDVLNAALCPTADSDWYAVSGLAGQIITAETAPLSSDAFTTDTYLNLYDAAGNLLDSDDDGGSVGYTSMISYELPMDGTYYFEVIVSSWAEGTVFDYAVNFMVSEPPPPDMAWNVYRDGALLISGVSPNAYSDLDVINGTTYCYTVTQIMPDQSESDFSNEDCATPEAAVIGDVCSNPIYLTLPVSGQTGSSEGFNNDYDLTDFMSGIDIVYSFSIPEDGTISGSIVDAGNEWSAMFIMAGCPDEAGEMIAEASGISGGSFAFVPISAGDYFLIVSNWPSPDAFSYTFDLNYQAGSPPMVGLLSPVSDMMVTTLTPEFLWQNCTVPYAAPALSVGGNKRDYLPADVTDTDQNSVDLVTSYDFYLGMMSDLSDAIPVEVVGGRYSPTEPLMEDQVYFWSISANNDDGSVFYSDTASFWTNSVNSAPAAFGLISPTPDGTVDALTPTFSWQPAGDADLNDDVVYNIYLGPSISDLEMVSTGELPGIMDTAFTLAEPLEDNTTYYWTVEARDNQGATTYNTEGYHTFHVNMGNDAPSVVDLVTPDSVLVLSLTPEMYWTSAVDVDPLDVVSYEMHWWADGMASDSVSTDTNSVILPRALEDNTMYAWNVIAMDANGGSSQSQDVFFWTDLAPEPPLDFALISPANDATGLSDLPAFEWEVANDPDPMDHATYTLEIATDSTFSQIAYTAHTNTAVGFEMNENLTGNAEYWWRVIAKDSDSLTTASDTYKFTVGYLSVDHVAALPEEYILQQNYPNPFNPSTTLHYGIPEDASVTLLIYDIRGNLVKTIASGYQHAGWYDVKWNGLSESGQQVPTGFYLARFQAGSYSKVVKMLYLK
ncbi:MAG: hypothetical protein AUJ47_09630 [Candidatus Marinimicrobia bacterium CG1_02_48_14]|nr:MAG: hypothetical protein AUJ47_09630 [Candidatus Marinimicrobia bacterium CG1_02_48_14]